ncbi:MAG TPA: multiheme c-type cytochrome [Pseudomonadales bacterium]|nr:multiheme c-type cytochrome [Pseudomonadales bacterium]
MTRSARSAAVLLLLTGGAIASTAVRAELPQYAQATHEGVATCASGVCHGSGTERSGGNVLQNEFVTWTRYDKHAGAYDILLGDDSKRIAKNLGLPNAHEAGICLDCHADNVPEERRGDEFQITDGVGCEACHGGAENWLAGHTADGRTHDENIAAGLYPTESIEARAELCLSCHLGTADKFATHRIMGAGHPRLSFELSTFSALQPPHWAFDDDYARRKGATNEFETWTRGVVAAARQNLALLQGPLMHDSGLFPEIALFDCHSCHHPMSEIRWQPTTATLGLQPGVVRINDANFVILLPIAEGVAPALQTRMLQQIRALNGAVTKGRKALDSAAAALDGSLAELEEIIADAGDDAAMRRKVLDGVLSRAVRGDYRDYVAAEQAAMAMDLLLITLDRWESNKARVDALFASVADDEAFRPAKFAAAADSLRKAL